MKKVISLLMSIIITGSAVPAAQFFDQNTSITSSAAELRGNFRNGTITVNFYADGHAELAKCEPTANSDITIPEKVFGYTVTEVNDAAFQGCINVESITLPDTVTSVGKEAFGDCRSLTSIDLSDNLEEIGPTAFAGCSSIRSIELPDSVTSIGQAAFWKCSRLNSVNIPEGVKDIHYLTFANTQIKSITLPKSVQRISRSAFDNCNRLESITIMNPDCLIGVFDTRADINTDEGRYIDAKTCDIFNMDPESIAICCDPDSTAYNYAANKGAVIECSESAATTTSTTTSTTTTTTTTTTTSTTTTTAKPVTTTVTTTYKPTAEGFVRRMYNIVLNREADSAGLKNWTNQLNNRTKSAADIIMAFFNSSEYQKRNKSSEQMVIDCYKAMLNRGPDAAGKANWKKYLDTGMTIQVVCKGIVGSSEFKNLCKSYGINPGTITIKYARDENYERTAFVYRLYQNCLGRTPDKTGLENWCKNLKNGTTGAQAVKGFFKSKEFTGKKLSNRNFVETIYRTMLGRAGDSAGLNSWTKQLSNGKSRTDIINGFLFSGEFKKQCANAGIKVGSKI
jgi:hypothetical protein